MIGDDERWMERALALAEQGLEAGEVPVGAVLVGGEGVLGKAWNSPIGACDPTAHAEISAIRQAARAAGNYRLTGTTLYVTLEPCPMCAGAIVHARVRRLVFGAFDDRTGAAGSVMNLLSHGSSNHRCLVTGGVLEPACADILRRFFAGRRGRPQA